MTPDSTNDGEDPVTSKVAAQTKKLEAELNAAENARLKELIVEKDEEIRQLKKRLVTVKMALITHDFEAVEMQMQASAENDKITATLIFPNVMKWLIDQDISPGHERDYDTLVTTVLQGVATTLFAHVMRYGRPKMPEDRWKRLGAVAEKMVTSMTEDLLREFSDRMDATELAMFGNSPIKSVSPGAPSPSAQGSASDEIKKTVGMTIEEYKKEIAEESRKPEYQPSFVQIPDKITIDDIIEAMDGSLESSHYNQRKR